MTVVVLVYTSTCVVEWTCRLWKAIFSFVSSLHARLSHWLHHVLVLSVVKAIVSQPCPCHDAITASSRLVVFEALYHQTLSKILPAWVDIDWHWKLCSVPGHVAPSDFLLLGAAVMFLLTYISINGADSWLTVFHLLCTYVSSIKDRVGVLEAMALASQPASYVLDRASCALECICGWGWFKSWFQGSSL